MISPIPLGPGFLAYAPAERGLRQRRFRLRTIWEPQIRLSDYRVNAVVDWVDIQFELPTPSQFRHVQDHLRGATSTKHFVEPLDDDHNSCHRFRIRVQDPGKARIQKIVDEVDKRWGTTDSHHMPGSRGWGLGIKRYDGFQSTIRKA